MLYILTSFFLIVCWGILEKHIHNKHLSNIPLRIHVNGIRGKSSTTRLIAAGLREAGFKVLAKTTGTSPRIIYEDGSEIQIKRRGSPQIIEQKKLVSMASRRKVEVLVLECMAISPEMQWISEHEFIKAHLAVITNVRQDHTDEMGASLEQIMETLALSIPTNAQLVTAEKPLLEKIEQKATQKNTRTHFVTGEHLTDHELKGFGRPVFLDNLACALKVCTLLDVDPQTALRGMYKSAADPGVLKVWRLVHKDKNIFFVNAFAANDYLSTVETWNRWRTDQRYQHLLTLPVVGLFNNRLDRGFRLKELAKLCYTEIAVVKTMLIGQMQSAASRFLVRAGVDPKDIIFYNLKNSQDNVTLLVDGFANLTESDLVVFAFGNIKGHGQKIIDYFARNGDEVR